MSSVPKALPPVIWDAAPLRQVSPRVHPAAGDPWVMLGHHRQPIVGVSVIHERPGDVTKLFRHFSVYELKIRGVASDLVRAEFDDVDLWEGLGATWLRTSAADTAELYGLIKRIETLGLVLLAVDTVDADESGHPAPP